MCRLAGQLHGGLLDRTAAFWQLPTGDSGVSSSRSAGGQDEGRLSGQLGVEPGDACGQSGLDLAAVGIEELDAVYLAGKRHELDQRQTMLMMRDEQGDGAPPRTETDLEGGTAVIRLQ